MLDLYTIIAQIINFLIFLFLLNKFLFKPVLGALEKRRADIKKQIEDNEEKNKEAERLEGEYYDKLKEINIERDKILHDAKEDIKKYKEEEILKMQNEANLQQEKLDKLMKEKKESFLKNFEQDFGKLFLEYGNAILKAMANANLQEQIVNVFVDKINKMDEIEFKKINNEDTLEIISSDAIENHKTIEDALKNKGFTHKKLMYRIDESLILGFEIKANGYVLSWGAREIIKKMGIK
ncbi:MAG: hypothetical protein LBT02_01555 [Rickettsiales bacterium]|jgi:F-type H+-transporting ATPase subunit b|nr:hypothetical protein [Rickettsiales bacterium]